MESSATPPWPPAQADERDLEAQQALAKSASAAPNVLREGIEFSEFDEDTQESRIEVSNSAAECKTSEPATADASGVSSTQLHQSQTPQQVQTQGAGAGAEEGDNAEVEEGEDFDADDDGEAVKFYGPGGLISSGDGSVQFDRGAPGKKLRRPEVPNRIVLLPVYAAKDLLEIICSLLPSKADRLRDLYSVAQMPKYISVIHFLEELAMVCQDIDQEEEIIQGREPVDYWLELEDKLQSIGLKRLKPRRYTSISFNVNPKTNSLAVTHGSSGSERPEFGLQGSRSHDEVSQQGIEDESAPFGPDGLPILRLDIPADDFS